MSPESRRASASHRHWKLNWWDLWPLVDGEQRPVQWTLNSLILSPHPSSPVVLARSFPSSSSFSLPSPNPVINNPSGYSSPSVIEVSPSDEYVFAFFDGKGNDGVGCIWHREETIDTWKVNIFWPIKPGQGIVLAKWLGEERMWLHTTPPARAPPLGPSNQFGKTTLLLVNQSHTVQIVHRPSPSFQFQLISASLRHASQVNAGDRAVLGESTNGPGGLSVCVRAAIGMGYHESSLIVATSSTLIPPASIPISEYSNPFGVAGPSTPPPTPPQSQWEKFGPEKIVRLCEVKITAHGFILGMSTMPMSPLFPPVASSSRLADILMIPYLPPTEVPSSPEGSIVDNGTASSKGTSNTFLHVVLSFVNFENYSSPSCQLMSFELQRNATTPVGSSKVVAWCHRHLNTRTIANSAVSFILPSRIPGAGLMMAGLLDLEGAAPRISHGKDKGKAKVEIGIGKIVMLKIPELENDLNWEPSILMTGVEDADVDPPISATISPGGSLVCTSPAAWSGVSKLGVQALPCRLNSSIGQVAESLLSTLLSDRPPTDVLHSLLNPALPLSSVTEVLEHVLRTLDCEEFSTRDWHSTIIGILLEVFRARSKRLSGNDHLESKEKATVEERWHVAMDLCSVKSLVGAFEACKDDDDGYDLEPVWQLISLSTWLVDFVERLLRTCILWEGDFSLLHAAKDPGRAHEQRVNGMNTVNVKMETMDVDGNELSPPPAPFVNDSSMQLLHILHPFTLKNLTEAVTHLNAFRAYLDTLQASGLKTSIAKDVLVDVVDCSGINFKELLVGLTNASKELKAIDDDILRRCLCSLTPLPATHGVLLKACNHITSEIAVSKPRLFIKPADLVDGISRLNLAAAKINQERDIVSKGVLGMPGTTRMCARCKGRTETGQTPLPRGKETSNFGRWAVWEHEWERCICGGLWMRDRIR